MALERQDWYLQRMTMSDERGLAPETPKSVDRRLLFVAVLAVFAIVWSMLLPFGDEPDFGYRIRQLEQLSKPAAMALGYDASITNFCQKGSVPLDQLSAGAPYCGAISPLYRALRYVTLFLIVFLAVNFFKLASKPDAKGLWAAFLLPGMFYNSTVVSMEALFVVPAALSLITRSRWVTLLLLASGAYLDTGSTLIVTAFHIYRWFWRRAFVKFPVLLAIAAVAIFAGSLILGIKVLYPFTFLPVVGKQFQVALDAYSTLSAYVYSNYPVVLRPVITFTGLMVYTPLGYGTVLTGLAVYLLLGFFFVRIMVTNMVRKSWYDRAPLSVSRARDFAAAFTFAVYFVQFFAGYSNGKYMIFLAPLFLNGLFHFMGTRVITVLFYLLSVIALAVTLYELAGLGTVT